MLENGIFKSMSFEDCDGKTNSVSWQPAKLGSVEDIFLSSSTVFFTVRIFYFQLTPINFRVLSNQK